MSILNRMNSSLSIARLAALLALVGALVLATFFGGCAATRTTESTGQYVDNTVITTKVKSALLANDEVKSFAISVESVKGVVQLSGFVDTAAQKSAAGRAASAVPGVKRVMNNLIVK